jgi:site-specific recombinase XerD
MKKIRDPALFKTIKAFLTVYLPSIKIRSPHTVQAYKDTLNLFIFFMKVHRNVGIYALKTEHFNKDNVIKFLEWLKAERGNSDTTRNQRLMGIRVFCKYLAGENVLVYDSYAQIQQIEKIPVPERFMDAILSIDDMRLILEAPAVTKKTGLRDQFYIALLYDSGCRNQELLDLKLGDIRIDGETGSVNILGKGRKSRVTPLSKEVVSMHKKYIDLFHPDRDARQFLFYTMRKGIAAQMSADNVARFLNTYEKAVRIQKHDIPHLHPHLFRHVRAMHLYQAGMPLPVVSQWLGHSNVETTLIYAYADTEMKKASVNKIINAKNSVFTGDSFIYQDDEEIIKKLYGLT